MKNNRHLIISGILFTIVLFLWPFFMGISQPKGTEEEQLNWILNNLTIYKIQFFFAFLISPSIIYLMLSQLDRYLSVNTLALKIGLVFLTGYAVLSSIAYASQMIIVPKLIAAGLTEQARVWYMGSSTSVIYFINQLGYCFWGIGTIVLFARLTREKGMIKYLSMIYILSSILSILAFIGLILDSKAINSMTLYGGLILVPVGILTIAWGIRENRLKHLQL